jgi:hypothetical protein
MKRCKKIVMNAEFELGVVSALKNNVMWEKKIVGEWKPRIRLEIGQAFQQENLKCIISF